LRATRKNIETRRKNINIETTIATTTIATLIATNGGEDDAIEGGDDDEQEWPRKFEEAAQAELKLKEWARKFEEASSHSRTEVRVYGKKELRPPHSSD
jgi:hypothetical protein